MENRITITKNHTCGLLKYLYSTGIKIYEYKDVYEFHCQSDYITAIIKTRYPKTNITARQIGNNNYKYRISKQGFSVHDISGLFSLVTKYNSDKD